MTKDMTTERENRRAAGRGVSYLSVYHEGGWAYDAAGAFSVSDGRYGGWRGYAGEGRVVWNDFRYGRLDSADFLALCRGTADTVPGSYGKVAPAYTRIDVASDRPLSKVYQKERRAYPEMNDEVYASFTYVVRHFHGSDVEWAEDYEVAAVVRGADYPAVNWRAVEESFRNCSDMPRQVLCYGSPRAIEDFLCSKWQNDMAASRWRIDIRWPAKWKRQFCEAHDLYDIYASDWVKPQDVVWTTQELVCPEDSDNGRGMYVGIRSDAAGKPVLSFVVEYARRAPEAMTRAYFGPYAEVKAVYGDDEIVRLGRDFVDTGMRVVDPSARPPVVKLGSLDCERFWSTE